jgi:uncharacterized protein YabE (DUF348 family)
MRFSDFLLIISSSILLLIFLFLFLKPFFRYFYYRYIDKSPVTIVINGRKYHIDRKSKKFVVEQMEEQDKNYDSEIRND